MCSPRIQLYPLIVYLVDRFISFYSRYPISIHQVATAMCIQGSAYSRNTLYWCQILKAGGWNQKGGMQATVDA